MKDTEKLLVSTVIPVYNGAAYLGEAIESVLNQQVVSTELIVVDDGSTDNTPEIARKYADRLRYIRKEHSGISQTMNQGVMAAGGDFLAFLDADDYWLPGKLENQLQVLREEPSLDMAFTFLQQFFSPEKAGDLKMKYKIPGVPEQGMSAGTMLVRRSSFMQVGLFNESLKTGQFNDWFMRARDMGLRHRVLPDLFHMRRVHGANHGIVYKQDAVDYLRGLRAHLKRSRESQ